MVKLYNNYIKTSISKFILMYKRTLHYYIVRDTGIEPMPYAWEAHVLPLN